MPALYIDRSGLDIELDGHSLLILSPDAPSPSRVPIAQVDFLLLNARNRIDARILARLIEQGSTVVLLSGRGGGRSVSLSGQRHGEAQRRLAQYQAHGDPAFRLRAAKRVLSAKFCNQHRLLRQALATRPDERYALTRGLAALRAAHRSLKGAQSLESLRGIEGAAASAYFAAYAALLPQDAGFTGRNRRPPRDPVNALLSLGYTLLMADARNALHRVGLDPLIGALHELEHHRDALACDLIEPFRPEVDRLVWRLMAERTLTPSQFEHSAAGCFLNKTGRGHFYAAWEAQAPALRQALWRAAMACVKALPGAPFDDDATVPETHPGDGE